MNALDAYAEKVSAGRIPAGKYHRLACERHLADRAREGRRGFPYRLELPHAERFFRFASQLRHYKGRQWKGKYFDPTPCQLFRLGSVFGWRHQRTGYRRFTTAYNELPRKNGKTFEASIVGLYANFFEGEAGAEGYCIATKRQQACRVYDDMARLVTASGLRSRIQVLKRNMHREQTACKFEPLGADADSTDGLNPHVVVTDELHAMKTRALLDVMESSFGSRVNPLHYQITTAGADPLSPCGQQHDYAVNILERTFADEATEAFFCFIAHADVTDDWLDEQTWRKANPHYGVSVVPDELQKEALKAKHMAGAEAEFKRKRLNLWVHAETPWLSLEGWRRGQTTDWTPADLAGEPCWIGIDLSSKIDLTAVVLVFRPTETRVSWRLVVRCLTPADTLANRARRDRAPYESWVEKGLLLTNPGNRIDQRRVRDLVHEAATQFEVQAVGIDPWNAGNLVTELTEDGFLVAEVPQTFPQMSQPSKDFEADVLDGLVDANDHELMTWCVGNVVVSHDNKENIYPTKRRSRGRIDPVIAALIGRKLASLPAEAPADDPELVVV